MAIVAFKRQKRLKAFEEHFAEALDLLGRAVRAGHAFTTGLEMISKEAPEPIAGEFRKTFEEQNFGLPLRDSLLNLAERVPLVDVRFFVTALLIQKETGGNLAEILDESGAADSRSLPDLSRSGRQNGSRPADGHDPRCPAVGHADRARNFEPVLLSEFCSPIRWARRFWASRPPCRWSARSILWKIVHIEV